MKCFRNVRGILILAIFLIFKPVIGGSTETVYLNDDNITFLPINNKKINEQGCVDVVDGNISITSFSPSENTIIKAGETYTFIVNFNYQILTPTLNTISFQLYNREEDSSFGSYLETGSRLSDLTDSGTGTLSLTHQFQPQDFIKGGFFEFDVRMFGDGTTCTRISDRRAYKNTSSALTPTLETTAEVQAATGQSFSITPIDVQLPTISGSVPDVGAVLTLEDSSTTIQRADGSIIEVKQETVVVLNPSLQTDNYITLIRGEVATTIDCNYGVRTALASITSCPTTKKGADAAKFTTNYSQSDLDGTLIVSVETGSVDIIDREGNTFVVSAGEEKTITNRVPRTQWVLPVDEDKLYGGENNFLIWTQFPNAVSYQMEFNLPTPDFSEQNASTPQFTKQVIPLTAGSYVEFEELALLNLPLPKGADGLVLELRIFALDSSGNIIGESVSSDSISVTVTD